MCNHRFSLFVCLALGTITWAGCSGGTTTVAIPSFDPEGSAEKAMELYDTDGDGALSDSELDAAPGIKAAIRNLDSDSDGKVSSEEIAARIRAWEEQKIGLISISCELYMDGQPLDGATITFEPESILGDVVKSAVGKTGLTGTFRPKIPKEQRPTPDSPPGLQAGLYRVKVSKMQGGKETIPARYNSETILGQQIAKDDFAVANKMVIFKLKSK